MSVVRQVLSGMDWNTGFTIPVADDGNKSLEATVVQQEREMDARKTEVTQLEERVHAMNEHLSNVRSELKNCQHIVAARKRQVETEDHSKKLSEREIGRLQQEMRRLKANIEDLHEKKNSQENQIFTLNKNVEDHKSTLNWDEQALEAWLEESAKRDEDMLALSKYSRQDEAKVKELSLQLGKMTDDRGKKHRKLEHETMETQMAQVELDRVAEDFRQAHEARRQLLQQWEQTVEQMQRRDNEMERLAEQLQAVKLELSQRQVAVRDRQQLLENQSANNHEYEVKIGAAEKQSGRLYAEKTEAVQAVDVFDSELKAFKRTVDRTSTELEKARAQVSQLRRDIGSSEGRLESATAVREDLEKRLAYVSDEMKSAEQLANEMDTLVQQEEKGEQQMDVALKRLREAEFKRGQETYEIKQKGIQQDAEISGSEAVLRNLRHRVTKIDSDSLKQQEIVYNQDFALHQLEHRLGRMSGETSSDERVVLEKKQKELQGVLDTRNQAHQLLTNQLKLLNEDVRRVERDIDGQNSEETELATKLGELELHSESSSKLLTKLNMEKQELMVESNVLQLQVRRLQKQLTSKAGSVMSHEKKQLELDAAMKERRDEIHLHQDMLSSQLRSSETERSQIATELTDRRGKIEKLNKRYEILMVAMAPPEGEEEHSQAYYVIKAAQEREELQRKGDELDAKIRKAEKELRAMENTLAVLNGRNDQYRKSFQKVGDASDEMNVKEDLDEQLHTVMEKWRTVRRQLQQASADLAAMKESEEALERDQHAYGESYNSAASRVASLEKELEEQNVKLERASGQLNRLGKALAGQPQLLTDIELRERRDLNRRITKSVADISTANPDFAAVINMYFAEANLPAPGGPGGSAVSTARSSRASSVRSSVSSQGGVKISSVLVGGDLAPLTGAGSQRSSAGSSRASTSRSVKK